MELTEDILYKSDQVFMLLGLQGIGKSSISGRPHGGGAVLIGVLSILRTYFVTWKIAFVK